LPLRQRAARLRREYAGRRFEVLAICFSKDLDAGDAAAAMAKADLPIVTDWGDPSPPSFSAGDPDSAVSWALKITGTPAALLVDADGKEVARGMRVDEEGWDDLKQRIEAALRGEAQPPEAPSSLPGGGLM